MRLDNGHLLRAWTHEDQATRPGQRVRVQLSPDDLKGWRLARRP
ncbi:MAG TPA: hypothetical protein VEA79_04160 [Phenylobacterium sp.]|nr:hypothetical protein [Phenylobacterium sp.]